MQNSCLGTQRSTCAVSSELWFPASKQQYCCYEITAANLPVIWEEEFTQPHISACHSHPSTLVRGLDHPLKEPPSLHSNAFVLQNAHSHVSIPAPVEQCQHLNIHKQKLWLLPCVIPVRCLYITPCHGFYPVSGSHRFEWNLTVCMAPRNHNEMCVVT